MPSVDGQDVYTPHDPVLLAECVELLGLSPGDGAVDGTSGGGGHTSALLDAVTPGGWVVAIDKDPAAIDQLRTRFADRLDQVTVVHRGFDDVGRALTDAAKHSPAGVLLDLARRGHAPAARVRAAPHAAQRQARVRRALRRARLRRQVSRPPPLLSPSASSPSRYIDPSSSAARENIGLPRQSFSCADAREKELDMHVHIIIFIRQEEERPREGRTVAPEDPDPDRPEHGFRQHQ